MGDNWQEEARNGTMSLLSEITKAGGSLTVTAIPTVKPLLMDSRRFHWLVVWNNKN
jgi:hypothetical protein